jgi:hypothetical protein
MRGELLVAKVKRQPLIVSDGEWGICGQRAEHFINAHVMIDEPHGEGVAVIPFHLWASQAKLLADLAVRKLVIILKARQLGISWLVCAYVLWLCLFRPGRVVLLLSKGDLEAQELTRRVRVMYERLPEWMRNREPLVKDNTSELGWSNGSRVQSLAATRGAGRSFTASVVILDEMAFMQWGESVYTAVKPTIDAGGQLFIVSTANGDAGFFHKLWEDAVKGFNSFLAVFLSWRDRPGRDDAWRAKVEAEALTSALDLQEYPATPEEAFQATGNERFLPSMLLWDACREDLPQLGVKEPMVVAMDAATSGDSFAVTGVTRHPAPARHMDIAVRGVRAWVPPKGGQIDFQGTPDNPGPELFVRGLAKQFNIVQICYDPYQLHDMATRMRKDGVAWLKEFSQAGARLEADKALSDLILQRRIAHDGNPTLRAHIDNADRKPDIETRKLRIVKRESSLKVDLAVALSMASYECERLNL